VNNREILRGIAAEALLFRGATHVPLREPQECRPVRAGSVSSGVLAKSDVAIDERGVDRREFACAEILFAEKSVYRACSGRSQEHTFCVHPAIAFFCAARTDKHRSGRTQRDQLVRSI
jgi:hypothetical protein